MTDYIPQASASDHYEAARKALAHLSDLVDVAKSVVAQIEESREAESMDEVFDARNAADDVLSMFAYQPQHLDALRALIAPPPVGESEEAIAERVLRPFCATIWDNSVTEANLDNAIESGQIEGAEVLEIAKRAVRAGIQHAQRQGS